VQSLRDAEPIASSGYFDGTAEPSCPEGLAFLAGHVGRAKSLRPSAVKYNFNSQLNRLKKTIFYPAPCTLYPAPFLVFQF
jgi:hypothetical protein